ncbi:hypothetical protein HJFPF1_08554 [Paramyrothecium foliicola]|nr:hypothetical protein HJFPF1_08554 [Paramyrothecium foliicola]
MSLCKDPDVGRKHFKKQLKIEQNATKEAKKALADFQLLHEGEVGDVFTNANEDDFAKVDRVIQDEAAQLLSHITTRLKDMRNAEIRTPVSSDTSGNEPISTSSDLIKEASCDGGGGNQTKPPSAVPFFNGTSFELVHQDEKEFNVSRKNQLAADTKNQAPATREEKEVGQKPRGNCESSEEQSETLRDDHMCHSRGSEANFKTKIFRPRVRDDGKNLTVEVGVWPLQLLNALDQPDSDQVGNRNLDPKVTETPQLRSETLAKGGEERENDFTVANMVNPKSQGHDQQPSRENKMTTQSNSKGGDGKWQPFPPFDQHDWTERQKRNMG